jgi:hypothetical protein
MNGTVGRHCVHAFTLALVIGILGAGAIRRVALALTTRLGAAPGASWLSVPLLRRVAAPARSAERSVRVPGMNTLVDATPLAKLLPT